MTTAVPAATAGGQRANFSLAKCLVAGVAAVLLAGCAKPDYETLEHGSGRFADLQGRHVFINYWAGWCKPCITELPELNEFAREFDDRVVVLAVNYDGVDRPTLERQARELDIRFPVLLGDPAALLGYQRPQALPSTFVFGPDGALQQVLLGPQTLASLEAAIGGEPQPVIDATTPETTP